MVIGIAVSLWGTENVLGLDGSDGYTTPSCPKYHQASFRCFVLLCGFYSNFFFLRRHNVLVKHCLSAFESSIYPVM